MLCTSSGGSSPDTIILNNSIVSGKMSLSLFYRPPTSIIKIHSAGTCSLLCCRSVYIIWGSSVGRPYEGFMKLNEGVMKASLGLL